MSCTRSQWPDLARNHGGSRRAGGAIPSICRSSIVIVPYAFPAVQWTTRLFSLGSRL
jgi:hypothetical protein